MIQKAGATSCVSPMMAAVPFMRSLTETVLRRSRTSIGLLKRRPTARVAITGLTTNRDCLHKGRGSRLGLSVFRGDSHLSSYMAQQPRMGNKVRVVGCGVNALRTYV